MVLSKVRKSRSQGLQITADQQKIEVYGRVSLGTARRCQTRGEVGEPDLVVDGHGVPRLADAVPVHVEVRADRVVPAHAGAERVHEAVHVVVDAGDGHSGDVVVVDDVLLDVPALVAGADRILELREGPDARRRVVGGGDRQRRRLSALRRAPGDVGSAAARLDPTYQIRT